MTDERLAELRLYKPAEVVPGAALNRRLTVGFR
jgi:hypothetical protein